MNAHNILYGYRHQHGGQCFKAHKTNYPMTYAKTEKLDPCVYQHLDSCLLERWSSGD